VGNFTTRENQILMPLVADCVNYGLTEAEALAYIKVRLGRPIGADAYYKRKRQIDSGKYANEWVSWYTKVGFLIRHKQSLEKMDKLEQQTWKDYLIEWNKPEHLRNPELIIKYRNEMRKNVKLETELSLGTPIVAQIKAN